MKTTTIFKISLPFLLLTLAQVFHSSEEMVYRLYDWQPAGGLPKRLLLFRERLAIHGSTFALMNLFFIVLLCLLCLQVYRQKTRALELAVAAACIELLNGKSHIAVAAWSGRYLPGCVTAFLLIAFATAFLLGYFRNRGREILPESSARD